jgi:hypothetical protein
MPGAQARPAALGGEASFLPGGRGRAAGGADGGTLVRHGADGRGGRAKVLCAGDRQPLQVRPNDRLL